MKRSPIARKTRLRPVNRARKAKRLETDFGGKPYLEFIHGLPCAVCEMPCDLTVAAHLTSRGAGGKAADIVPLCAARFGVLGCHEKYDLHHESIRAHEPRLRSLAKRLWREFQQQQEAE